MKYNLYQIEYNILFAIFGIVRGERSMGEMASKISDSALVDPIFTAGIIQKQ